MLRNQIYKRKEGEAEKMDGGIQRCDCADEPALTGNAQPNPKL